LIFILLSIAILSASFTKSVQKYCSPGLFEATKEFITSIWPPVVKEKTTPIDRKNEVLE